MATYDRGTTLIDTFLISPSLIPCIRYCYLLHNNFFQNSDHKEVLLDLYEKKLFKYKLDKTKLYTSCLHMNQRQVMDRYSQLMETYEKHHKFK